MSALAAPERTFGLRRETLGMWLGVLGVAFFKGVPVGPLIAAGLLSLMVGKS